MKPDSIPAILTMLYGAETGAQTAARVQALIERARPEPVEGPEPAEGSERAPRHLRRGTRALTERDALVITYADQFQRPGAPGLQALEEFADRRLHGLVSGLHILPFYPSTSDDGFAVADYRQVDPALGDWSDVERLAGKYRLMFDAVINHVSASSAWFQNYLLDRPPYTAYFLAVPPDTDLSQVVRPRALPLLTPFDTLAGEKRWLWTTFSADQLDLNYTSPDLLVEILEILLEYSAHGAQFLRLDAIAYLWKQIGTSCIHLPQTHAIIRLIRAVLEAAGRPALLITETNVPHADNLTYFGAGDDEAHLVYNFALPPLVLHAIAVGDAGTLAEWAAGLELPWPETTFFNFLASHDGIGLNPARGILSEREIAALQARVLRHGGLVSYKNNPDGTQSAYELNISYFDALSDPAGGESEALQVVRFLAAQAVLLALRGLPGIYIHSLIGSRSWAQGVVESGHNRTINRQKFALEELDSELLSGGLRQMVFQGFARLLRARAKSPAFDPYGEQRVLPPEPTAPGVLALWRGPLLCLHNLSIEPQLYPLRKGQVAGPGRDLLSGAMVEPTGELRLAPYQVAWVDFSGQSAHLAG